MYGSVLEDFAPLVAGSTNELKRRNNVCAWFQPTDGQFLDSGTAGTFRNQQVYVRFVIATVNTNDTAGWSTTQVAGLTFSGHTPGSTPIGTRHFGVLVARGRQIRPNIFVGSVSPTVRGRLYVQRQHTIEI